MKRITKITACAVAAVLSLTSAAASIPSAAYESELSEEELSRTINVNDLVIPNGEGLTYDERTKDQIGKKFTSVKYGSPSYIDSFEYESSWYETMPSFEAPYNYGTITQDTKNAMLNMLNYYRWLIGVPEIQHTPVERTVPKQDGIYETETVKDSANGLPIYDSLRLQAFVRNYQETLGHSMAGILMPEGMNAEDWTNGCVESHTHLSMKYTPQQAPKFWINEGYDYFDPDNNVESKNTYKHRIMALQMRLFEAAFNFSGDVGIVKCGNDKIGDGLNSYIGSENEELISQLPDFSAFPPPGYVPADQVIGGMCSWTLEWNTDKYQLTEEDLPNVTVTIENTVTGDTWTRRPDTQEDDDTIKEFSFEAWGNKNTGEYTLGCITFLQPDDFDWSDGKYNSYYRHKCDMMIEGTDMCFHGYSGFDENGYAYPSYKITVEGLKAIDQDVIAEYTENPIITYTVNFFDLKEHEESLIACAASGREYWLSESMMTDEGLEAVRAILPDTVNALSDNDVYYQVPVKGEWKLDKANQCFINSGDISHLQSAAVRDPNGILDNITIPYYQKSDSQAETDTITVNPEIVPTGESFSVSAYRRTYGLSQLEIYKLYPQKNGSYTSEKWLDAIEMNIDMEPTSIGFTVPNALPSDSGMFISVYYEPSWMIGEYGGLSYTPVFVSNDIGVLTVTYDLNGDKKTNIKDLVKLTKMIHGLTAVNEYADLNGDGRVNIFDLIILRENILEGKAA